MTYQVRLDLTATDEPLYVGQYVTRPHAEMVLARFLDNDPDGNLIAGGSVCEGRP